MKKVKFEDLGKIIKEQAERVAKMQVDTFKYNGINLAIYETSRGYTINNINFYNNIKELKATYRTLAKKMSGKTSY